MHILQQILFRSGFAVAQHVGHFKALNATDIELAGVDEDTTLVARLTHDAVVPPNTNIVFQVYKKPTEIYFYFSKPYTHSHTQL